MMTRNKVNLAGAFQPHTLPDRNIAAIALTFLHCGFGFATSIGRN